MCGTVAFYTEAVAQSPADWLCRAFGLFGPGAKVCMAGRHLGGEWESFIRLRSGNCNPKEVEIEMARSAAEVFLRAPESIDEVSDLLSEDAFVHVFVSEDGELARRFRAAAVAISENIRADFVPWEPIITIGFHDIFESLENEDGHLYGRAFFSLRFDSSGIPFDLIEYRRLLFGQPEIDKIREEFEAVVGPLKQCVFWEG